jgi:hypothetical protein
MRKLILSLIGCLLVLPAVAATPGFSKDEFLGVVMEYSGPSTVVSARAVAIAGSEDMCKKATVSAPVDPKPGDLLVGTCVHVKFTGPVYTAVATPVQGIAMEILTVGVRYDANGQFVGAQALHVSPDMATCLKEGKDVLDANRARVPTDTSIILYCLPVYRLPSKTPDNVSSV